VNETKKMDQYQMEALHNVRRTAETARTVSQDLEDFLYVDTFQHIIDELRVAGIHEPEDLHPQLEFNFFEDDNNNEECPECKLFTLRCKELGGVECTNQACGFWFCY
jgi:hypothetical protein